MRFIRFLIIVLTIMFVFWQTSAFLEASADTRSYNDVSSTHKNFIAIEAMSEEGIIQGYPNGEFHPEGVINRAEAVKILTGVYFDSKIINRALNMHQDLNHWYATFPDVKINDWFAPYTETSYLHNIIEGYPDGLFRPANSINFAEALKVILETADVDFSETHYTNHPLLYVGPNDWYTKYFIYAYDHNLINREKFYHPAQLITRGEFVEIMYRLQNLEQTGEEEFTPVSEVTSNEYTLTIPRLNITDLNVHFADIANEQNALEVLKQGVGHYLSTPGSGKKMVIFGHSSGYSWDTSAYKTIFKTLDQLQNGDIIYINYKEKGYRYEVVSHEIIPATQDTRIVENPEVNELALYTCWPPNSVQNRYVVHSRPMEK